MQADYSYYDFEKSRERIDEILAGADASYDQHSGIPARDRLTFTNGFYVDVTVMFIDIRGSKGLAEKHSRPVLAKMYRSYISETVAVLKDNELIHEIYIEGDGIWAVFDTKTRGDIQSVAVTAGKVMTLIKVLNVKFAKRGYSTIKIGIGIEDGPSLYVKAGYKGSSINEVVWLGRAVGAAAKLCGYGNETWLDETAMISEHVYNHLIDSTKALFSWSLARECYTGTFVYEDMNNWVLANE